MQTIYSPNRWSNASAYHDHWGHRVHQMFNMFPANITSVADYGCGRQKLKELVPPEISYIGIDSHLALGADIQLNLNARFTEKDLPKADVAFFSGVFEYIACAPIIARSFKHVYKYIIFSYNFCTPGIPKNLLVNQRRKLGWVNDYTPVELLKIFEKEGALLAQSHLTEDSQSKRPYIIALLHL